MNRRILAAALVLFALAVGHTRVGTAQTAMEAATAHAAAQAGTGPPAAVEGSEDEAAAMPAPASETVLEHAETRQRYLAAMQRYYEYRANGYAYRSRVFEWQLLSSRLIFIVVLALVGAGLYFAAVQFRLAMRAAGRKLGEAQPDAPGAADVSLATRLELSAKGVVVNSSVLGVIILGLSLAFFYLYLVHVYPIRNVF
jgi:hypothetical protein